MFPSKVVSQLASWKRSTFEDFKECPYATHCITEDLVSQHNMFFTAVIERASGIRTVHWLCQANIYKSLFTRITALAKSYQIAFILRFPKI